MRYANGYLTKSKLWQSFLASILRTFKVDLCDTDIAITYVNNCFVLIMLYESNIQYNEADSNNQQQWTLIKVERVKLLYTKYESLN